MRRGARLFTVGVVGSYLQVFESDSEVVLLTASAGERLVAVLPLIRKQCWASGVPLTKLMGAANVHSVRFDILRSACPAGRASIQALWQAIKRMPGWHFLEFPYFPQSGACADLLAQAGDDGYITRTFLLQDSPLCGCKPTPTAGLRGWAAQAVTFATNCVATPGCWKRKRERNTKLRDGITRSPRFSKSFLNWKPRMEGQGGSAINCSPETRAF